MAEEEQQLPEAPFPAPPPFWKHFTVENQERLKAFESSEKASSKTLPLPLAYLRPPPPPPASAKDYKTFSQTQVIDPTKPSALPLDELLFKHDDPNLNHAVL